MTYHEERLDRMELELVKLHERILSEESKPEYVRKYGLLATLRHDYQTLYGRWKAAKMQTSLDV